VRRLARPFLTALLLAQAGLTLAPLVVPAAAFAQAGPVKRGGAKEFTPPTEEERKVANRKAKADLGEYGAKKEAKKPFPWMAVMMASVIVIGTLALLYTFYKGFAKETYADTGGAAPGEAGAEAEAGGGGAKGGDLTPKDRVLGVVQRAGSWVAAGRVAAGAKVEITEAAALLEELASEGHLESGRDGEGRMMYRAPAGEA
jgi:hypothetical protein